MIVVTFAPIDWGGCHTHLKRPTELAPPPGPRHRVAPAAVTYCGCMGMLILFLLAAVVLFLVVSAVISALHFLFWLAVVLVVILGALRLTGAARRWSRR